ncbi:MAG: membrane integrity-associated transporter subunit PqiC [Steroidobacteraceae bacterium]
MRLFTCAVAVSATAFGALAAGCSSSPPLRYYTLTEVPGSGRLATDANTMPVRLDRVTIPPELDRSQVIRRIDATRLEIFDGDRWAAPLEDTIRRVLSGDLATRLPPNMVANPNEPLVGEKRQSLSVDITEFSGDATCAVTLRAAWVLKQPDSQSSRGSEEASIPASGGCSGAGALPTPMSQALAQLSDRIATAIARSPGSSGQ